MTVATPAMKKAPREVQLADAVIPTPGKEKKMSTTVQQDTRCGQLDATERAINDEACRRGVDVLRSVGAYMSAMAYGALVVFTAVAATR